MPSQQWAVALRLMATSCMAGGLSPYVARICPAILGEIGGCGVSALAKACMSWWEEGGTSLTELLWSSTAGGMRMGELEQGDLTDGL